MPVGELTSIRGHLLNEALGLERKRHAKKAIARGGLRVVCNGENDEGGCGFTVKLKTWRGRRLRSHCCPHCGGRLRPVSYAGLRT
jgi:hypothetical protein